MALLSKLQKVEKKYAIGLTIGIPLAILGLYYQLEEKNPNLQAQILSQPNVLDVKEKVDDLQITFKNQDIQSANLNLRIYTIKFENTGSFDILQTHFDQNNDWGISLENGKFIKAKLLSSNADYINANLNPSIETESKINFNKIIFDKNKYFTIEALVLHNKSEQPNLKTFGKIAGVDRIEIEDLSKNYQAPSIWKTSFAGGSYEQIIRVLSYGLAFLIFIVALVFGIALLSTLYGNLSKLLRKHKVKNSKDKKEISNGLIETILSEIYIEKGGKTIKKIKSITEDRGTLFNEVKKAEKSADLFQNTTDGKVISMILEPNLLEPFVNKDIMHIVNNQLEISSNFHKKLNQFIETFKI